LKKGVGSAKSPTNKVRYFVQKNTFRFLREIIPLINRSLTRTASLPGMTGRDAHVITLCITAVAIVAGL
jgi:hypothetical protein